jgi:hypothetical protein
MAGNKNTNISEIMRVEDKLNIINTIKINYYGGIAM